MIVLRVEGVQYNNGYPMQGMLEINILVAMPIQFHVHVHVPTDSIIWLTCKGGVQGLHVSKESGYMCMYQN